MASAAVTPASVAPDLPSQPVAHAASRGYNVAVGYLRGFLVILVLAHHSAVAYFRGVPTSRAPLLKTPMLWRAFPVVDPHAHSALLTLFLGFNDTFFMALMFFVSGLFVWPSLMRKGNAPFLRDRFKRLGIPFLFAAAIVAPLAYYPSYLIAGGQGFAGYVHDWLSFGDWPTGPAWFIWLLLAFDLVVAAIFAFAPGFSDALSRLAENAREHPVRFFAMFVAASMAAYVPMVAVFGPAAWTSIGPFQFQTARLFHYAVYFFAGIGVGAYGIDRGLLAPDGKLARHWGRWTLAMLVIFVASIALTLMAMSRRGALSPGAANLIGGFCFVPDPLHVRIVAADGAARHCARTNHQGGCGVFRSAALELGNQRRGYAACPRSVESSRCNCPRGTKPRAVTQRTRRASSFAAGSCWPRVLSRSCPGESQIDATTLLVKPADRTN